MYHVFLISYHLFTIMIYKWKILVMWFYAPVKIFFLILRQVLWWWKKLECCWEKTTDLQPQMQSKWEICDTLINYMSLLLNIVFTIKYSHTRAQMSYYQGTLKDENLLKLLIAPWTSYFSLFISCRHTVFRNQWHQNIQRNGNNENEILKTDN